MLSLLVIHAPATVAGAFDLGGYELASGTR